MFGMGGMDPKKIGAMMSKMGIKQEEVEATRVVIESSDRKIVISNPQVVKITMQGNESWQITGETHEETGVSDEDVKMVAEKSGKSVKEARKALEDTGGDIASAIMALS